MNNDFLCDQFINYMYSSNKQKEQFYKKIIKLKPYIKTDRDKECFEMLECDFNFKNYQQITKKYICYDHLMYSSNCAKCQIISKCDICYWFSGPQYNDLSENFKKKFKKLFES